ncbi:hypothetical protein A8144_06435 [Mycobacterium leprae 3125609]|nr:hypothetical protein A8144_06435 [Mycobacterium leprae 3125609]OAX71626.1 hypothetical protein A3216_04890 [Mycobacterium leprae 7935681]
MTFSANEQQQLASAQNLLHSLQVRCGSTRVTTKRLCAGKQGARQLIVLSVFVRVSIGRGIVGVIEA